MSLNKKPRRYGRRANREGTVFKRMSDDRWCAMYSLPDGRRKTLYAPKDQNSRERVSQLLAEALASVNSGQLPPSRSLTVRRVADEWLMEVERNVRWKTFVTYRSHIKHIVQAIGNVRLTALTPSHLNRLYADMTNSGYSASTVRGTHGAARTLLTYAYNEKLVSRDVRNVVSVAKPPPANKREVVILTDEQIKRLLEAADKNRYGLLFQTLLFTGLRIGEALALSVHDLQLDGPKPHLTVRATMSLSSTGYRRGEPKTGSSRRNVPLEPGLVVALTEHIKAKAQETVTGFEQLLFTSSTGRAVSYHNLRSRYFTKLREDGDLPNDLTMHHLRHFFGSWLLSNNTPLPLVSKVMGHADIGLTAKVYAHQLERDTHLVAEHMSALRVG